MTLATLIALLFVLGAVITVVPRPSAVKKSMLGYRTMCSFAPVSTFTLLMVAGVVWLIGSVA